VIRDLRSLKLFGGAQVDPIPPGASYEDLCKMYENCLVQVDATVFPPHIR
jgi:hypothetical protein